jgi:hypothetical protein
MNLPFEIVNRILYFASIHNDKKYVPEFDKKGKLHWKLNFQHSVFSPLKSLYQFRSSNRVKEYTRVSVVPAIGISDAYRGRGFPVSDANWTYTEFITLTPIHSGANDTLSNSVLITYPKPDGLMGNTVYVSGTLYTNTPFNAHGDTMPTLVNIDKITRNGDSELVLGVNTSQYWQFNPVLQINEYIINVDMDYDIEDGIMDTGSLLDDVTQWDHVIIDSNAHQSNPSNHW